MAISNMAPENTPLSSQWTKVSARSTSSFTWRCAREMASKHALLRGMLERLQRIQHDISANGSDQSALSALAGLCKQLSDLREEWTFSPVRPDSESLRLAAELDTRIRDALAKRTGA
jgi:hypothetical protein